jgi:hypothetical protein
MTADNKDAPCDHKWEVVHDWIGDQNVVNGTQSFTYWRCKKCDDHTDQQPDDWCDPRELDADVLRDRWIDDDGSGFYDRI